MLVSAVGLHAHAGKRPELGRKAVPANCHRKGSLPEIGLPNLPFRTVRIAVVQISIPVRVAGGSIGVHPSLKKMRADTHPFQPFVRRAKSVPRVKFEP